MTHCTRTILIAQLVISGMIATLMTGIFGFLKLGATAAVLQPWGANLVMAWPIAFML